MESNFYEEFANARKINSKDLEITDKRIIKFEDKALYSCLIGVPIINAAFMITEGLVGKILDNQEAGLATGFVLSQLALYFSITRGIPKVYNSLCEKGISIEDWDNFFLYRLEKLSSNKS